MGDYAGHPFRGNQYHQAGNAGTHTGRTTMIGGELFHELQMTEGQHAGKVRHISERERLIQSGQAETPSQTAARLASYKLAAPTLQDLHDARAEARAAQAEVRKAAAAVLEAAGKAGVTVARGDYRHQQFRHRNTATRKRPGRWS